MPAAVTDPRFRDQAAKLLFPFGVPHRLGHEDRERWDRVAKALAEMEARVQAAANQRAAEELRQAAGELDHVIADGAAGLPVMDLEYAPDWLRDLAAALASPAPAPRAEAEERDPCYCCGCTTTACLCHCCCWSTP